MKKFSLILCFFTVVFCSCERHMRVDISVMPEATTEGKHTFGCLVDGWAYVGGRYYDQGSPYIYDTNHSIVFDFYESAKRVDVCVKVEGTPDFAENRYLKFSITNVEKDAVLPRTCEFVNARFSNARADNGSEILLDNLGTVKVTNIIVSDSVKMMSGIFYGTRITEGRFDVNLKRQLFQ